MTKAQTERLYLLVEECAEVIQIAQKCLRHGYASHHPVGGTPNWDALTQEMGDLRYSMILMCAAGDVEKKDIHDYAVDKAERVGKFLHHQPHRLLRKAAGMAS